MRTVVCPAGDGEHIHAESDDRLARAVLIHARSAHPELGLDPAAAQRLVADASHVDRQHSAQKTSWTEFTGMTTTGTHLE